MRHPLTILIVGCGVAGPALAYWLVRRGHAPLLVERHPELRAGGHAVDIRGTALTVVERMGLEGAVREARTQIHTLSAVGARRRYDLALRPLRQARGDREVEIMRDDLVRILHGSVADDVEVLFGDSPMSFTRDGSRTEVTFGRNESRTVDIVVGADGQHSAVRRAVFGPDSEFVRHLGAYVCIYTVDNFLHLHDQAVLYNDPGRGAAMFTVRGNQKAKVVLMFHAPPSVGNLGDTEAQQALLRTRFAGMGWETGRLIASMREAEDFYFDQMSQVRMPRWSQGDVVLLGDAGFCPSPLSGQGTSLALIGGYGLAYHMAAADDVRTGFGLWENGFRANVTANQDLARQGMSILLPDSRFTIAARNQALRAMPLLSRLGAGFGGRIERVSRAYPLPDD